MNRYLCFALLAAALLTSGCIYHEDMGFFGDELDFDVDDTSVPRSGEGAFSQPVRNIRDENREEFARGQALFRLEWDAADVGPVFNAIACSECHANDGRGEPESQGILFRLSVPGPSPEPTYGGQFQPRGVRPTPGEGAVLTRWQTIDGTYDDGTSYELRQPEYRFVNLKYGPMAADMEFSPRLAQQIIGLGLLEAVPESEILRREDPDDDDRDGISGRANWVEDVERGSVALGRFGWKAGQPNLKQQNAAAFAGDLGMTSSLFEDGPCTAAQRECLEADLPRRELMDRELEMVTAYTRLLAPPAQRGMSLDEVQRGESLFERARCSACHVPEMQTGASTLAELSDQRVRAYTDLLLHDMGPRLSDGRPEAGASGTEWRTPPLWGIGMLERVNGHTFLLHDGRARNVEEAILWHGGEAEASRDAFAAMNEDERRALILFVNAL